MILAVPAAAVHFGYLAVLHYTARRPDPSPAADRTVVVVCMTRRVADELGVTR